MLFKPAALFFIVLSVCILRSQVIAEESPLTQEEWNPPSAGPIITWTAPVCSKGEFVIQPFFFYNLTRGQFDDKGHYNSLIDGDKKYQYQEQLLMQYGITDKLELDAQTVYQQNYIKQDDLKAHDAGFGDSYLYLRYCLLEEGTRMPYLNGVLQVKMPTGKFQNLDPDKLKTDSMGTGSWDPGFGINLTKRFKPFIFHADAAYSFPQGVRIDGVKTIYGKYLNYDFGVEYFFSKGFNLMLEANGFLQGDNWVDGSRLPGSDQRYLMVCPGIGWSNGKVQTLLAYQRVVTGTNTDANDSVVLTCVYTF
jgi:hypothetical protein